MPIPDYESRLDQLFLAAFETNNTAMLDWVNIKFELKALRNAAAKEQSNPADCGKKDAELCWECLNKHPPYEECPSGQVAGG